MGTFIAVLAVVAFIGYCTHHGRHYRRHRRAGFGFWYSVRGPFGTRETISKRF